MVVEIDGEYATAEVFLDEEHLEESAREQIQSMVNHEAISGNVRIMPDTHLGSGSVIGFTMPIDRDTHRVVPNIVGVDIGCGMYAVNLGREHRLAFDEDASEAERFEMHERIDSEIREQVPFGREVHSRNDYHIKDDFPWGELNETLAEFESALGVDIREELEWFDGYDIDYFKQLCRERAHEDITRAINSLGSLGGGNHFIELGESVETGDLWAVIHSGSRGIGAKTADYWQERAADIHDDRADLVRRELEEVNPDFYKFDLETVSDSDLLDWVQGGMGEDFKDMDAVRDYYSDDKQHIEATHTKLQAASQIPQEISRGNDLDYLEGSAAYGYFVDMIFCQRYASESRKQMADTVAGALAADVKEEIESVHNFIDFSDLVIRKGACPARDGERIVIPFNMRDGTIIARGKGNDEWNQSAPHGAGRVMSRTQAFDELDFEDFEESMDDVFSTSVTEATLDEAPFAYKRVEVIEDAIGPTAEIIDRLEPVHNLKAEQ